MANVFLVMSELLFVALTLNVDIVGILDFGPLFLGAEVLLAKPFHYMIGDRIILLIQLYLSIIVWVAEHGY